MLLFREEESPLATAGTDVRNLARQFPCPFGATLACFEKFPRTSL